MHPGILLYLHITCNVLATNNDANDKKINISIIYAVCSLKIYGIIHTHFKPLNNLYF